MKKSKLNNILSKEEQLSKVQEWSNTTKSIMETADTKIDLAIDQFRKLRDDMKHEEEAISQYKAKQEVIDIASIGTYHNAAQEIYRADGRITKDNIKGYLDELSFGLDYQLSKMKD
ncbi:hypothetical protein [Latilactobacillus sakei]|uniref:hypothetical protein n=1 Tax=Latilactobacillus sakei TaxID=1599 RepID=UPI000978D75A|nr:hypothetical protein [Latilactobacillus sakei]